MRLDPQDEAKAHRECARQIRKHLEAYGSVLGIGRPEHWAGIAARKETLAAALELEPIGRVA